MNNCKLVRKLKKLLIKPESQLNRTKLINNKLINHKKQKMKLNIIQQLIHNLSNLMHKVVQKFNHKALIILI
jgi:hypothetical protein